MWPKSWEEKKLRNGTPSVKKMVFLPCTFHGKDLYKYQVENIGYGTRSIVWFYEPKSDSGLLERSNWNSLYGLLVFSLQWFGLKPINLENKITYTAFILWLFFRQIKLNRLQIFFEVKKLPHYTFIQMLVIQFLSIKVYIW